MAVSKIRRGLAVDGPVYRQYTDPLVHCSSAREGDSMIIRFRAASAAPIALVLGLSMAAAGCGKYSVGTLKAIKSFKDGNLAYAQKDWKKAVEKYEEVIQHPEAFDKYPQLATSFFFLGNSYDQLYEDSGRYDDAEAQYAKAEQVKPNDPSVLAAKAGYYNRQGDFPKTIDALEKAAALEPNNPEGYHRVATFYWEKANKDYRLSP